MKRKSERFTLPRQPYIFSTHLVYSTAKGPELWYVAQQEVKP